MTPTPPRLDPFDAAVITCLVASIAFALLIAGFVRWELVQGLLGLWPLFLALSGIAWLTIDAWAPMKASPLRQVGGLAAFVAVEALASAPLVAVGWEVAGPRAILGAAAVTGMTFAALAVFSIIKPTTYLEPIDPLVVLLVIVFSIVLVGLGLHIPIGLVWATPLVGVTGVLALDQTAKVFAYTDAGQWAAGGTRLFACVSVLFAEFIYYFVSMVRGEECLWDCFIRRVSEFL